MATINMDSIQRIELALRNIISEVLISKVGPNWLETEEHGLGSKEFEALKTKQKEEKGKRPAIIIDQDLFSYADFSDLRTILEKKENRGFFDKIFTDWETFIVDLRRAEDLRNPAKHHRVLYDHEVNLLEGIAGEIEHYIDTWHLGCRYSVKRYRFHFRDLVSTKDKDNQIILDLSMKIGNEWMSKMRDFFKDKPSIKISESTLEYSGTFNAGHINLCWSTSDDPKPNLLIDGVDYKGIEIELSFSPSSRIELNDILRHLNKRYYLYVFELDGHINVDRLINVAEEMAAISPSSKGGSGPEGSIKWESAEYTIGHYFSIGVGNTGKNTSQIFIRSDLQKAFNNLHEMIRLETILAYLLGNLPRRLIVNILKKSIE